MVTELTNYTNGEYKTANRVKLWVPLAGRFVYLLAEWDTPPTGYGSKYRSLARSKCEEELKIWWGMRNESIPLVDELVDMFPEDEIENAYIEKLITDKVN